MGYKRQGIWPSSSQLKNLASNDVDAKLFDSRITRVIPYLSTRLNLPNSPGSHRTLRELPQQLHHATAFPRPIRKCHTSHDPPTTLLYLLEALEIRGREAGARGRENRVENLPSGDPITCRIHRLASTPLPPRATATINVHILCRHVHAVNDILPGRQQVNGNLWPPTPTQLQQVLFYFRTKPAPHLSKPHIQTTHSTQPTHTGLTTANTTITHMIRMDPKSTRPGARGRENRVENLPSGDPITCRMHRLASTPLPPRATATINVHILCRQVHAVNDILPGRQQVNGHLWPPTPTQLQQVLFYFRTKHAPHLSKPHIQTTHSTQPTHTGLTMANTTITHMIRMDPKSTRCYNICLPELDF
ncbi:hypothetical protein Taro_008516 [Colocasia esculenta]|uniref:Uncharacterized protein n=1 Tax=Colocasia esculenta TaxID=4460 RepID=A0A843U2I8_COLES|nr:hypothetical protein [Colocasia esculenta]